MKDETCTHLCQGFRVTHYRHQPDDFHYTRCVHGRSLMEEHSGMTQDEIAEGMKERIKPTKTAPK